MRHTEETLPVNYTEPIVPLALTMTKRSQGDEHPESANEYLRSFTQPDTSTTVTLLSSHEHNLANARSRGRRLQEPTSPESAAVETGSRDLRSTSIVVIEPRRFFRECIILSLKLSGGIRTAMGFASVAEWRASAKDTSPPDLVLLVTGDRQRDVPHIETELAGLAHFAPEIPRVLIGESEAGQAVMNALDSGAQGYIPTSVAYEVAIEALHLVRAGGVYAPVGSLVESARGGGASRPHAQQSNVFSARQLAVIACLREGKSNKVIAHELGMREGTVKVHLRNIMRKLKATNRTQVVSFTAPLFDDRAT